MSGRDLTSYPRVSKHIGRRIPHGNIVLQQMSDKVLGIIADVVPIIGRKLVDALLDAIEQELLTVVAILSAVPSAIAAALAYERTLARQHYVDDNAQAPQVASFVVRHVVDERFDHLGSQILGRSDWCTKLRGCHWCG